MPQSNGAGNNEVVKITRRRFLKLAACIAAAAVVGIIVDAVVVEPKWIKVTNPVVRIADLPPAWEGVRIAQLTDIHVGRLIDLDYVRKIVEKTNAAKPDVIVLTGDYVSRTDAIDDNLAEVLGRLQAPFGKFAVLGNHDHWTDPAAVRSVLAKAGIVDLTGRNTILNRGGAGLCLAGLDDLWEGRHDLSVALAGVDDNVPRVLLCHNPDYAERMPASPRVDLMLCGHSHGGQFKIPFGPRPRLPIRHAKYAAGLASGPHCQVYTSVGLGMIGIPIRFNCRPELAVITLRRQ